MDALFDLCVQFLLWLADLLGVSYNAINIWIFCIIWPAFTLLLLGIIIRQAAVLRRLKRELSRHIERKQAAEPRVIGRPPDRL